MGALYYLPKNCSRMGRAGQEQYPTTVGSKRLKKNAKGEDEVRALKHSEPRQGRASKHAQIHSEFVRKRSHNATTQQFSWLGGNSHSMFWFLRGKMSCYFLITFIKFGGIVSVGNGIPSSDASSPLLSPLTSSCNLSRNVLILLF